MTEPDYAEVLRLHRKYAENTGEPLWKVFVRVGRRLEKAKPDRCKACLRTHLEYSRLIGATCDDTFHAAPSLEGIPDDVGTPKGE